MSSALTLMTILYHMNGIARMGDNALAILGGRGMLGTDLAQACFSHGWPVHVFDLPDFDITNEDQLRNAVDQAQIES